MPRLLASWMGADSQRSASVSREKQCFERDRPLLYVFIGRNDQEMSSPISGPHSEWNTHEDVAVANALVDSS